MAPPIVFMAVASERGLCNVHIATAQALLKQSPTVVIHILSFASLRPLLDATFHLDDAANDARVVFHPLPGRSLLEVVSSDPDPDNCMLSVASLRPGLVNTPKMTRFLMTRLLSSWTVEEYAAIFRETCRLLEELSPPVVVLDYVLSPVITAVLWTIEEKKKKNMESSLPPKIVVLNPNSLKDFTYMYEGLGALLTKWPLYGTALEMPMSIPSVLKNVYYFFRMIVTLATDRYQPALRKRIRTELQLPPEAFLGTASDIIQRDFADFDVILLSSCPEADFPDLRGLAAAPPEVAAKIVCCGPIVRPTLPLVESDPALLEWLHLRGRAVLYINLGTVYRNSQNDMAQMARSLRLLFDAVNTSSSPSVLEQPLSVLWKLQLEKGQSLDDAMAPDSSSEIATLLGQEIKDDRIRIVSWLEAEPSAVLGSGSIVCAITHGGAGAFAECITNGIPQIVLPVWADTYDFANRVELMGLGRWGNPRASPTWTAAELGPIMVDVLLSSRAATYAANARKLAEKLNVRIGRDVAAKAILGMVE